MSDGDTRRRGWVGLGGRVGSWCSFAAAVVIGASAVAGAAPEESDERDPLEPLAVWNFVPRYELPGSAGGALGPRPDVPSAASGRLSWPSDPVLLHGAAPTERFERLLSGDSVPREAFSLELWVTDHVNRPVGALATLRGARRGEGPAWTVAYHAGVTTFDIATAEGAAALVRAGDPGRSRSAYKGYWRHVVAVYDGRSARLYVNGEVVSDESVGGPIVVGEDDAVEFAAYCGNEPYMDLGNIVRRATLFDRALGTVEVQDRFAAMRDAVDQGVLFPGEPHFTAGPYLHYATPTSVNITFETERPTSAIVAYGASTPLQRLVRSKAPVRLHEVTISDLEPGTNYFYRVRASDSEGLWRSTGVLTFKTAPAGAAPISFAVIGDTEARPHINDQIAKLVWNSRPDFVINCGDLTDGGKEPHKFEWTHEYFVGLNQLHSRVPAFPVPGNGEGDLHWYKRYHTLPAPEGYYAFRYGDAAFFMLDSNRAESEFRPGGEQYEWLKAELAACDATWKFACHHHPTWTSDEDDYGDTWAGLSVLGDEAVRRITDLYDEYGVDMVFFGHLHSYERSWPMIDGAVTARDGVRYVQAGGAGGNLEDFAPTRSDFKRKTHRGHHFCTVDINGPTLSFRAYDIEGDLIDALELTKDTAHDAATETP